MTQIRLTTAHDPRRWPALDRLRIDHLWLWLAVAAFGALAGLTTIDQVDFWWHMALGREIAQLRFVPVVDTHNWTLPPNTPFIYGSWLAEWIMYQLHLIGGVPLLILVRNALLIVMYTLVGLEARRRSGSWRLAALAVAGFGMMTLNNVSVRPQIFAWLPLAGTALLLGAFRSDQIGARWLLMLPLVMIWWVNVHGSFVIGLGLIGLTCVGETLVHLIGRAVRLNRRRLGWLWSVALLTGGAALINPRGVRIADFVQNLAGHPAARQWGGEWQPPQLLAFPGVLLPLALLLIAWGFIRAPRRFSITDALLLLALSYLGASSIRNLLWFGMIAWPMAAAALARSPRPRVRALPQRRWLNLGGALALCVPLLLIQPPFKAQHQPVSPFGGLGHTQPDGVYLGASTPVAAVDWIRSHPLPPHARLFHDMAYGSYLMWALPDVPLFIDGRIELYPYDHWLRYRTIVHDQDALAVLQQTGATHALLSNVGTPELVARLGAPQSGWRQLYTDDQATLFERIAP